MRTKQWAYGRPAFPSAQDPALAIEKPLADGETALLLLNRETDTQNVTVLFDEL